MTKRDEIEADWKRERIAALAGEAGRFALDQRTKGHH
jgi:hypothetical protein